MCSIAALRLFRSRHRRERLTLPCRLTEFVDQHCLCFDESAFRFERLLEPVKVTAFQTGRGSLMISAHSVSLIIHDIGNMVDYAVAAQFPRTA